MFIKAIGFVGLNVYNTINVMILLKCVSMSNQECMVRPTIVDLTEMSSK